VTDRIDLRFGTECLLEIGDSRGKNKQRIAHLLLAGLVPVRNFELSRALLPGLDAILEYVNLCDVLRVGRIDQCPDPASM
jgi:hypothetical protein